jgi:uncharacterized protein YhbP (UPF0306 family)
MANTPQHIGKDAFLQYLQAQKYSLGVLATLSESGLPYPSNVFFGWDDNVNLYFASKRHRAHSQHLFKNPHVAVSFINSHKYTIDSPDKVGVQIQGMCRELQGQEAQDAFKHYAANILGAVDTIATEELDNPEGHSIFKIDITFAKVWDEQAFGYDGALVDL